MCPYERERELISRCKLPNEKMTEIGNVTGEQNLMKKKWTLKMCKKNACIVKIHRLYNTNCKPQCKLWTIGGNDDSMSLIKCNKYTILMWGVASGRWCVLGGIRVYEYILNFPLTFSVNLMFINLKNTFNQNEL